MSTEIAGFRSSALEPVDRRHYTGRALRELRCGLVAWTARRRAAPPEISEADEAGLRALGYIEE